MIARLLDKLAPLRPREVAEWRRALPLVAPDTRTLLEKHIIATAHRLLGDQLAGLLLPPPPGSAVRGLLTLGTVHYLTPLYPFGLHPPELCQHLGIYGRSGAGKTNLVFQLLLQLDARKIPWCFLDWKRTCRHVLPLLRHPPQVFTPGRSLAPLQFNPFLCPPGVEAHQHRLHLIDILAAAYTLGDGARHLLEGSWRTVEEAGRAVTPSSLEEALLSRPVTGRAAGWQMTAARALSSLRSAAVLEDVTTDAQHDLSLTLLATSSIIELNGLDAGAKRFLIPALLQWLFHACLVDGPREQLRLVVVLEEAHHVLYRQEHRSHESLLNRIMRQCREVGLGMVVVDQHPHLISSAASGNAYATICLNQKEPSDLTRSAALLQLQDEDKRHLATLPLGQAVVKLQGRWQQPFLIDVPLVPVTKGAVTDPVLASLLATGTARSGGIQPAKAPEARVRQSRPGARGCPPEALSLLEDVAAHPWCGVKERYARLGWSADKGTRMKEQLVNEGLVEQAVVPQERTRKVVLQLTSNGKRLLPSSLDDGRRGSAIHEYWKQVWADRLRHEGWTVEVEAARKHGWVDVLGRKGSEVMAVEVETGKSDVVKNVLADLSSGVDKVLVVAPDEKARTVVEKQLAKAGLLVPGRVEVVLRLPYDGVSCAGHGDEGGTSPAS